MLLNLATDKARRLLRWEPVWSFERTIAETVKWYRESHSHPARIAAFTAGQIDAYTTEASAFNLAWAT